MNESKNPPSSCLLIFDVFRKSLFLFKRPRFILKPLSGLLKLIIHPKKTAKILTDGIPTTQEDFEQATESTTSKNWQALRLSIQELQAKVINPYVKDLYIEETRKWIEDSLLGDTEVVYQKISNRINNLLNGRHDPLFTPFRIGSPDETLCALLKSNDAESALEALEGLSPDKVASILLGDEQSALVHLIAAPQRIYAIIVQKSHPPEIVEFPSLTREKVENLLKGWMWLYYWQNEDIYQQTLESRIRQEKSNESYTDLMRVGWAIPHDRLFSNNHIITHLRPTEVPTIDSKPLTPFPTWLLMETILREFGQGYVISDQGLWRVLHEKLASRSTKRLIIAPDKALAMFPHHAAILDINPNGDKELLIDHYEISYVPQGSIGKLQSPQTVAGNRVLVFGTKGDNELYSTIAVSSLQILAPLNIVTPDVAAPRGLENAIKEIKPNILTFVGHGQYDWKKPQDSWLGLLKNQDANKNQYEKLMGLKSLLADVDSRLQLVVLAACGIGLPQIKAQMTEYRGFAEDLTIKGHIPTVVATLWPVHQLSTVLIMRDFHSRLLMTNQNHAEIPQTIPSILRQSQLWLRNLTKDKVLEEIQNLTNVAGLDQSTQTELENVKEGMKRQLAEYPFAHPYFWSPFYVMGGRNEIA